MLHLIANSAALWGTFISVRSAIESKPPIRRASGPEGITRTRLFIQKGLAREACEISRSAVTTCGQDNLHLMTGIPPVRGRSLAYGIRVVVTPVDGFLIQGSRAAESLTTDFLSFGSGRVSAGRGLPSRRSFVSRTSLYVSRLSSKNRLWTTITTTWTLYSCL